VHQHNVTISSKLIKTASTLQKRKIKKNAYFYKFFHLL